LPESDCCDNENDSSQKSSQQNQVFVEPDSANDLDHNEEEYFDPNLQFGAKEKTNGKK